MGRRPAGDLLHLLTSVKRSPNWLLQFRHDLIAHFT